MDVGKSLNPAIDIGQIEGGFVQGYGLFTLEEQRHSPSGMLLTKGPAFYKIPGVSDIPVEFNVSLLMDSGNPKAVYSSKVRMLYKQMHPCISDCICYLKGLLIQAK